MFLNCIKQLQSYPICTILYILKHSFYSTSKKMFWLCLINRKKSTVVHFIFFPGTSAVYTRYCTHGLRPNHVSLKKQDLKELLQLAMNEICYGTFSYCLFLLICCNKSEKWQLRPPINSAVKWDPGLGENRDIYLWIISALRSCKEVTFNAALFIHALPTVTFPEDLITVNERQ